MGGDGHHHHDREHGYGPTRPRPDSVAGDPYGRRMIDLPIDVIRSKRRTRTIQATLVNGRIRVLMPFGLDADEEKRLVDQIAGRISRRATSAGIDLAARAADLADRYDLPEPVEVAWSHRQMRGWGSCSPSQGRIRISSRLAGMPGWVLDWVLIHELAHLEVADHGPGFQALVRRYELAERAEGYLIAMSEAVPTSADPVSL
jgi:predicted metal-dependent hydrolase